MSLSTLLYFANQNYLVYIYILCIYMYIMRAPTTEPPTTNKEPGHGIQSSTSPRQRYQKKEKDPLPSSCPRTGPWVREQNLENHKNHPRTNNIDSNQKPTACGAPKTKNYRYSRENCACAEQQTKVSHREGPRPPDQQLVGTKGLRRQENVSSNSNRS